MDDKLSKIKSLAGFLNRATSELQNGSDGTYSFFIDFGVFVVEGCPSDYQGGNGAVTPDGYAICAKVATNKSSISSDYGFDWRMPWDSKTGEVYDTEGQIAEDENFVALAKWYYEEAKNIIDMMQRGELVDGQPSYVVIEYSTELNDIAEFQLPMKDFIDRKDEIVEDYDIYDIQVLDENKDYMYTMPEEQYKSTK